MFEMPEACPTSSGDTDDVDPDDAGPFATPRPIASATSGTTKAPYVQDDSTNARTANPAAARREPQRHGRAAADAARERRDQRRDRDHASGRGQRRQPCLERAHPERGRILEVQAEHVHQRVDRARDDEDRQRRPDEHAVAQEREVDERGARPPLDPAGTRRSPPPWSRSSRASRPRPSPSRCPC